jgi:ubiquinone/menaquinone biosynthesis C-methylase UbiE
MLDEQFKKFANETYDQTYFDGTHRPGAANYISGVNDGWHRDVFQKFVDKIFPFSIKSIQVVDAGCACGTFTVEMVRQGVAKVFAFDVSEFAINEAKRIVKERLTVKIKPDAEDYQRVMELRDSFGRSKANFYVAEPHNVPFIEDASIELYFTMSVFEHLNPARNEDVVKETSRIMRKGGYVFIEACFLGENEEKHIPPENDDPGHINVIKKSVWIELFLKHGFVQDTTIQARIDEVFPDFHWKVLAFRKVK